MEDKAAPSPVLLWLQEFGRFWACGATRGPVLKIPIPGGPKEAQTCGTEPGCSVVARWALEGARSLGPAQVDKPEALWEEALQGEVIPISALARLRL